jgi:hypothetical protein
MLAKSDTTSVMANRRRSRYRAAAILSETNTGPSDALQKISRRSNTVTGSESALQISGGSNNETGSADASQISGGSNDKTGCADALVTSGGSNDRTGSTEVMNDRRSNNTTGSAEPITGRANSAEPMMGRANSAEPNTVRSNKMAGPADASQISGGQTDYARISVGLNKGSEYAQIRVGSNNTGSADASQISGGSDKNETRCADSLQFSGGSEVCGRESRQVLLRMRERRSNNATRNVNYSTVQEVPKMREREAPHHATLTSFESGTRNRTSPISTPKTVPPSMEHHSTGLPSMAANSSTVQAVAAHNSSSVPPRLEHQFSAPQISVPQNSTVKASTNLQYTWSQYLCLDALRRREGVSESVVELRTLSTYCVCTYVLRLRKRVDKVWINLNGWTNYLVDQYFEL